MRTRPFDHRLSASYPVVIGCDEVGRGALCGPVVTAAAFFDPAAVDAELLDTLDDSKRLTARQRERLAVLIRSNGHVAIAAGSAAAIDRYGIRRTTLAAMRRSVQRLRIDAPVRFDGVDVPEGLDACAMAVVRGETTIPQIAAASVIAKVFRDRLMGRLALRHPHYGLEANAGYGTAHHLCGLDQHGPSAHHRRSFAPISRLHPGNATLSIEGAGANVPD